MGRGALRGHKGAIRKTECGRGCAVIGFTAYCTVCAWQRWFVERIDAERAAAAHMAREAGR